MMPFWPLPTLDLLTCRVRQSAHASLYRVSLLAAAALVGLAGCGFLIFAAYATLRRPFGPEIAALLMGLVLLALAALLARRPHPKPAVPLAPKTAPAATDPPASPPTPSDPATLAVFTASFLLGRALMDRWRP